MTGKIKHFTLIGRPTLAFRVTHSWLAFGLVPTVRGVTLDGKLETTARIADIVNVPRDSPLLDAS